MAQSIPPLDSDLNSEQVGFRHTPPATLPPFLLTVVFPDKFPVFEAPLLVERGDGVAEGSRHTPPPS